LRAHGQASDNLSITHILKGGNHYEDEQRLG
jgi:hypothetical protein